MLTVELTKPVRFVQVGEVAIVLGRGATRTQLGEALMAARGVLPGNQTVPAPQAPAAPFNTLNNDEDGTDRGPECTRCGRDVTTVCCASRWPSP